MQPKQVIFIGSSKKDLEKFPIEAKQEALFGINEAQHGRDFPQESRITLINVKLLHGLESGAHIRELKINDKSATFRVVYTARYEKALYILHAFQKKSKQGIKTPKQEIDLIKYRLKVAENHYSSHF